jgi:hypothetical protein
MDTTGKMLRGGWGDTAAPQGYDVHASRVNTTTSWNKNTALNITETVPNICRGRDPACLPLNYPVTYYTCSNCNNLTTSFIDQLLWDHWTETKLHIYSPGRCSQQFNSIDIRTPTPGVYSCTARYDEPLCSFSATASPLTMANRYPVYARRLLDAKRI